MDTPIFIEVECRNHSRNSTECATAYYAKYLELIHKYSVDRELFEIKVENCRRQECIVCDYVVYPKSEKMTFKSRVQIMINAEREWEVKMDKDMQQLKEKCPPLLWKLIVVCSTIILSLFSNWLYDELKDFGAERVVEEQVIEENRDEDMRHIEDESEEHIDEN